MRPEVGRSFNFWEKLSVLSLFAGTLSWLICIFVFLFETSIDYLICGNLSNSPCIVDRIFYAGVFVVLLGLGGFIIGVIALANYRKISRLYLVFAAVGCLIGIGFVLAYCSLTSSFD